MATRHKSQAARPKPDKDDKLWPDVGFHYGLMRMFHNGSQKCGRSLSTPTRMIYLDPYFALPTHSIREFPRMKTHYVSRLSEVAASGVTDAHCIDSVQVATGLAC